MTAQHTPEPWAAVQRDARSWAVDAEVSNDRGDVALCQVANLGQHGESGPNAHRIVACVNALAGLNPEAVALIQPTLSAIVRRAEIAVEAIDDGRLGDDGAVGDVNLIGAATLALMIRLGMTLDSDPGNDLPLAKLEEKS